MALERFIVTTSVIAETLGKTEQWVNQLARDGILVKQSAGRWDLVENLKLYVAFLESGARETENVEMKKLRAEADYKRHQADTAELELAELKGETHRSEDVEAMTAMLIMTVRSMLLALPGKLAVNAASSASPAEASAVIKAAVNEVLEELSGYRYNPDEYSRLVRERKGWKVHSGNEGHGDRGKPKSGGRPGKGKAPEGKGK